ncbi:unnamed protein product [Calicophoron daubneyi]|uniref:FHA domain-containing protein n=1 Tax=Calicophoron daubneyi TaxID=300641 RepID=A0AAV2TY70_CALDB
MEFDVFDKLSELETRIHFLKKEIEEKNLIIASLTSKNAELEQRLAGAGVTHQSNSEVTQPDIPVPTPKPCEKIAVVDSDLTKIGDKSIAEALKEASDSAVRSTGYTFDERTGLYYDHNSGYYYDPENQLFYEPRRGIYYSYNSETGEYTYQSSASRTQLKAQYEKLISDPAYQHEIKKSQRDVSKANFNFDRDSPRSLSGDSTHNRHRSVRRRRRRSSSSSARRRRRPRHRSRSTSATSDRSRSRLHRRRLIKYSSDSDASLPRSCSHSGRSRRHHKRHRSTSSHSERVHKDKHRSKSRDSGKSASDKKTCLAAEPVRYPPVVRLMVLASDHVPLGQVFIITSTESSKGWGCIGRSSHLCPSVNFPEDPAVSAIHCEIVFKSKDDRYILIDRDSQSGTYVNGQQISKKTDVPLCHGDVLRVGSSRLLVHIHDGQESCGQCDPEIVKAAFEASADSNENKTDTNEKILDEELSGLSGTALREAKRRATLDELKGKYGLKVITLRSDVALGATITDSA